MIVRMLAKLFMLHVEKSHDATQANENASFWGCNTSFCDLISCAVIPAWYWSLSYGFHLGPCCLVVLHMGAENSVPGRLLAAFLL